MLFDIGIEDMILGLDDFQRPTEYDASSSLPTGATVNIVGGSDVVTGNVLRIYPRQRGLVAHA